MVRRLLVALLGYALLSTVAATPAAAADAPAAEAPEEAPTIRDPSELLPKELAAKIKAMDPDDGAVRFARAMQRDGILFMAGGGVLAGTALIVGAAESISEQAQVGPYMVAGMVPVGAGLMIVGIPQVVLSQRLLGWYSLNGPAPSSMARLKLMRRWRLESLQWMRDASLFGGAFLGVAGVFSAVVWAVRDSQGLNGTVGDPESYRPLDALTSLAFIGSASALGVSGLFWWAELKAERDSPHRLYAMPTLSVGPTLATSPEGPPRATGVAFSAGLHLAF